MIGWLLARYREDKRRLRRRMAGVWQERTQMVIVGVVTGGAVLLMVVLALRVWWAG